MSDTPPPTPPVPPTGPTDPPTSPPSPPSGPADAPTDPSSPRTGPSSPPNGQADGTPDPQQPAAGAAAPSSPYGGEPTRFPPPESRDGFAAGYGQPGYGQAPYAPSGYQQSAYSQPGYPQPGYTQTYGDTGRPSGPKRGLAIAALIVGGVSVLLALIPFISYLAIVSAIVGVVLGITALVQKGGSRGLALTGLITSAVALLLAIVLSVVYTNLFITAIEESETAVSPSAPEDPFEDDSFGDDPFDDGTDDSATGPGSRDQPEAIGTTVEFFDIDDAPAWEIAPGTPTLDANSIVAADEYNDPPPPGTQYAILPLTITYVGAETGLPYEIDVQFVAADGTSYDTNDVYAVIPEDLYDVNELYPGGSATGNVVLPIPTNAIEGGAWAVSTSFSGPYFFEVQ